MDSSERRKRIVQILTAADGAVTGTALSKDCDVSRQIIVGDIALLRAASYAIDATPRGYVMQRENSQARRVIACRHEDARLQEELYTVVDNGCGVLDVIVEHPLYGEISGSLQIFSRYDVDAFCKKLEKEKANPLCALTGGIHLHTLSCPSEEAYQRVLSALREKGILFEKPEE